MDNNKNDPFIQDIRWSAILMILESFVGYKEDWTLAFVDDEGDMVQVDGKVMAEAMVQA